MLKNYRHVNLRRGPIRSFGLNVIPTVMQGKMAPGEGPFTAEEIKHFAESALYQPEYIYHFTSARSFSGICESRKMWATNSFYLNDTEETVYSLNLYLDGVEYLNVSKEEKLNIARWLMYYLPSHAPANIYVCCFSKSMDSLSQWRAYARGGVSIGFDRTKLSALVDNKTYFLRDVEYNLNSQKNIILQELSKLVGKLPQFAPTDQSGQDIIAQELGDQLAISCAFLKHPAFYEEREVRLAVIPNSDIIKYRNRGTEIIPYTDVKLQSDAENKIFEQLVFAPSKDDFFNKQHSFQGFLSSIGLECAAWYQSGIPYQEI